MDRCRVEGHGEGLASSVAHLLKGHPKHYKFIKSVTNFILIASYHSHTRTTLKYLPDGVSGIGSNIHLFILYRKSHSMNKIPKIHSLVHYIECIRDMGSADNSDTEISEAPHKTSSRMATVLPTRLTIFGR